MRKWHPCFAPESKKVKVPKLVAFTNLILIIIVSRGQLRLLQLRPQCAKRTNQEFASSSGQQRQHFQQNQLDSQANESRYTTFC